VQQKRRTDYRCKIQEIAMRQAALISVLFAVLLTTACQRKGDPPKPTVSMAPVAEYAS
jgi:hypothetical protein